MVPAIRIRITGTVQGVGFRPFVYRTAVRLGISGTVRNDSGGVLVMAAAERTVLDAFQHSLKDEIPPLARIRTFDVTDNGMKSGSAPFTIIASTASGAPEVDVTRDTAVCDACVRELNDPADRRYGHALINCTDCGPRYTIIRETPYDRPHTTMAGFDMCPECRKEYEDPADRRYHAQPVCCPECGPRMALYDDAGKSVACDDPVRVCAGRIADGAIAAVKGLGGYHLACRADDADVIARLRKRKRREEKPFALMVRDLDTARQLVRLNRDEERLLSGIERPIVLADKKENASVPANLAPGLNQLGIMLPYTPIHHLLFRYLPGCTALVMTSANFTDEPIVYRDEDALRLLAGVADCFLTHNRPIETRNDDSIVRVMGGQPLILRRARGYVPEPVPAGVDVTGIVACGAMLKSTVTVGRGEDCIISQHIGDAENTETLETLEHAVAHLTGIAGVTPELYVCDRHPDYLSTVFAHEQNKPVVEVQHHHAHAAACMGENGLTGKTVCIVYDGTGYGDDGTVWGGEVLLADRLKYERMAFVEPMPMPGGENAVRYPGRMALGALYGHFDDMSALLPWMDPAEKEAVLQMLAGDVNCVRTSGMGRLFDSLAALLDVCRLRTYEGQPAIILEGIADRQETGNYGEHIRLGNDRVTIDGAGMLLAALDDAERGSTPAVVAARFHNTVAYVTSLVAVWAAGQAGVNDVCLSGGVFQNVLLTERLLGYLDEAGLTTYVHRIVPPNDGCISYGQAVVAGARRAAGRV